MPRPRRRPGASQLRAEAQLARGAGAPRLGWTSHAASNNSNGRRRRHSNILIVRDGGRGCVEKVVAGVVDAVAVAIVVVVVDLVAVAVVVMQYESAPMPATIRM